MKFRKITAMAGSLLMAGLTVATAAAANYPAPFVDNGVADVAVVYGTGAGVSTLDMVQAGNIQSSLGTFVTAKGTTTVTGGEVFAIEKSSNMFNMGNSFTDIYTTLDDDEMPITLADGDYDDGDVDTEYSQKITLKNEALALYKDADLNDDEPTIGFEFSKNDAVLDYEIDLDDVQTWANLEGTDMPLMGKEYYVLDAATTTMTLLDSASTTIMSEGETKTVDGRQVSVIIGDDSTGGWAKFTVDGETVDKMYDGGSEELADGSWVAVKEVLYQSKESSVSNVEFTIGSGKLVIVSGEEVEMNEVDVDGVTATMTENAGNTALDKITISWVADEDTWLTESDSMTMPGFEALQLVYGGIVFPEAEVFSFDSGDELTIDMEAFDLPLYRYSSDTNLSGTMGEDNHPLIYDADEATVNLTEGDRFLITLIPTSNDLSDAETRYYEVSSIENDTDIQVVFEDLIGSDDLTLDDADATDDGDLNFDLVEVEDDAWITLTMSSSLGDTYMDHIVTETGAIISFDAAGLADQSTAVITVTEADKDDNLDDGSTFTITVGIDTSEDKLEVTDTNLVELETTTDNQYIAYKASDLASKITYDKSNDLAEFEVEYYGEEVTAEVSIASADATVTSEGASALGDVLVKDSEVDSVKAKNLVIVGGSCINSAAATVLGGAYCGEAFTAATGVGAGEFLIKGVQDAYTTGKLALVVAGYEAADTVNAATYLTKKDVDTSKEYKGTSATEASVVTTTA